MGKENKMDITFINPKVYYKYSHTPYQNLGIGYLAAMLAPEHNLFFVDGQMLSENKYHESLEAVDSEMVFISSTLFQLAEALRIADLIKRKCFNTRVVMGGAAFGPLKTDGLIGKHSVDIVVIGEAENAVRIIANSRTAKELNKNGLAVRKIRHFTEIKVKEKPDVNAIPLPLRNVTETKKYMEIWRNFFGTTSLHLLGSRGCPFRCNFCDKSVTGSRYRPRSASEIAKEFQLLAMIFSPDDIFYFDDLFTISEPRVNEVCEAITALECKAKWSAQARVDTVNLSMLQVMKRAGCTELNFGVESGSEKVLKILNKRISKNKIRDAFRLCHSVGIKPGAYLLVGVPGETKSDILETAELVKEISPSLINFSYLTPFPGTRIFETTKHLIKYFDFSKWDDFSESIYRDNCFEISPKDSEKIIQEAFDKIKH
ncbi:MAG TPA: radical SAM protein [bacterium]|nr:radical SAM protein [bacterium]